MRNQEELSNQGTTVSAPNTRLESWKEIANYLAHSLRTVRRWERQEGLPVRRHLHGKQGTIYAFTREIDAWRKGRSVTQSAPTLPGGGLPQPPQDFPADTDQRPQPKRPAMIAILPLRNLSGDPEQERFRDGLTEELITEIGQCCPGLLRVIAFTSVIQYKQSPRSIGQIGRELNVDYILEGAIRRYGRRVRLTARLISARDQAHVWADTYEIQLPPLFSMQQSLARHVAVSLANELQITPNRSWRRSIPRSAAPHNAYIEGRSFFFLPSDEDIKKKLEHLYLALDRDPKFARNYAELALVYFVRLFRDYPPIITFKRIEELASKALKLDSRLGRAHALMAAFHLFRARDRPKAEASSRRAAKLNPSDPWARIIRAAYHVVVGEPEKAMEELEQARQLGPQSPEFGYWFAVLAFFARQYDWAIERCQEMLHQEAFLGVAHALLGGCYAQKGDYASALQHCERAREFESGPIVETARACSTYALAGEREAAGRLLQELVDAQEERYVRYMFLAQASVALRDDQQTLEWLEKAFEQHDPVLVFLKADPRFEPLSDNPRFRSLLRRIGLLR